MSVKLMCQFIIITTKRRNTGAKLGLHLQQFDYDCFSWSSSNGRPVTVPSSNNIPVWVTRVVPRITNRIRTKRLQEKRSEGVKRGQRSQRGVSYFRARWIELSVYSGRAAQPGSTLQWRSVKSGRGTRSSLKSCPCVDRGLVVGLSPCVVFQRLGGVQEICDDITCWLWTYSNSGRLSFDRTRAVP